MQMFTIASIIYTVYIQHSYVYFMGNLIMFYFMLEKAIKVTPTQVQ